MQKILFYLNRIKYYSITSLRAWETLPYLIETFREYQRLLLLYSLLLLTMWSVSICVVSLFVVSLSVESVCLVSVCVVFEWAIITPIYCKGQKKQPSEMSLKKSVSYKMILSSRRPYCSFTSPHIAHYKPYLFGLFKRLAY